MAKLKHSSLHLRKFSKLSLLLSVLFILTAGLFMLLSLGIFSPSIEDDESHPFGLTTLYRRMSAERVEGIGKRSEKWIEVVSWAPRAFIYHNFLSKEECEYLINIAKPYMKKSTVVDNKTGGSKDSRVRTSTGTFLTRGRDRIVRDIEKRISDFTYIPVENGEALQILHYEEAQKYEPHYDYFHDKFNIKNGGNRMATMLMYLSDVEEGGETVFPATRMNYTSVPWYNELSECGKKGLAVKPKRGDAILFWSMKPDASFDPTSLHGSCPVIKGNKWCAVKWLHVRKYVSF